MEEQWNNVELSDLSKSKSYTLNHQYDGLTPVNNTKDNSEETKELRDKDDMDQSAILKPGSKIKPNIQIEVVEKLVRRLYGITTNSIQDSISYDDRNFIITEDPNMKNPLIDPHWPHGYVFKVLNALDSKKIDFIEAQNELMIYLSQHGIHCPKPVRNVNGKYYSVEHINGDDHVVRLLEYIPGKMFHQVPKTKSLLYQSGEYIAKVNDAVKSFKHDAYETHKSIWMLQSVPNLKNFMYVLDDLSRKELIEEIIEAFEKNVLKKLDSFHSQIIHGDYNEQNIIVEQDKDEYKVVGIIDFGDTSKSPLIFEVGIAMTYMMLQARSLERGGIFLAGYTSINPLAAEEKQYLKYCVAARLAQSLVMGTYTYKQDQSNDYVLVTQEYGWKLIEELWRKEFSNIDDIWQKTADTYLTQSLK